MQALFFSCQKDFGFLLVWVRTLSIPSNPTLSFIFFFCEKSLLPSGSFRLWKCNLWIWLCHNLPHLYSAALYAFELFLLADLNLLFGEEIYWATAKTPPTQLFHRYLSISEFLFQVPLWILSLQISLGKIYPSISECHFSAQDKITAVLQRFHGLLLSRVNVLIFRVHFYLYHFGVITR